MNNSKVITMKIEQELGLLLEKIKKDYPDIVKDYMKTTETRVFKVN